MIVAERLVHPNVGEPVTEVVEQPQGSGSLVRRRENAEPRRVVQRRLHHIGLDLVGAGRVNSRVYEIHADHHGVMIGVAIRRPDIQSLLSEGFILHVVIEVRRLIGIDVPGRRADHLDI